jgi:integrase
VAALRAHRRAQDAARPRAETSRGHRGFVFCTGDGRPLDWRSVSRAFKALLRRAELPDVPFHALRHTAATLLIAQGVHPKVMQERLGHSSAATTLDLYGHLLPGLGREAAARLDDLLA